MFNSYHLYGGAAVLKKLKVGATVSAGTPTISDTTNNYGEVIPATTTTATDTHGIALDTGTYTTTQATDMVEGVVTCDVRPDTVVKARVSGGATAGTDMTKLSNTSASAGGTTITDADVGTADMVSGTVWRLLPGGAHGESRIITTHNSGTSFVVTVPFSTAIAVGDEFLFVPFSNVGDGGGNVQFTSDFTEANGAIAAGTGAVASVVDLKLKTETNTEVEFVFTDHALNNDTLA